MHKQRVERRRHHRLKTQNTNARTCSDTRHSSRKHPGTRTKQGEMENEKGEEAKDNNKEKEEGSGGDIVLILRGRKRRPAKPGI